MIRGGEPDRVVGTSKTFRSLARITGAAPSGDGPYVRRSAPAQRPRGDWLPKLAEMTAGRAGQPARGLAGSGPPAARRRVVADAAMDLLGVDELEICPWALREGVILRRLD